MSSGEFICVNPHLNQAPGTSALHCITGFGCASHLSSLETRLRRPRLEGLMDSPEDRQTNARLSDNVRHLRIPQNHSESPAQLYPVLVPQSQVR